MNYSNPVTIGVATYNSEKTIIETLDSIRKQTYPNIKLIISDDCSSDDTIHVVQHWLEENSGRFISTKIITVPHNTGVSASFNRIWDACDTEWLKDIAGDDLLLPNCIENNTKYICEHSDAVVVFSRAIGFTTKRGRKKWVDIPWHDYSFFYLTPKEQYHYLFYKGNHLPAASCFYNIKELRKTCIRHDERIPLLEDYPKWVMFARKDVVFHFLDKPTVEYRLNEKSLSVGLYSPVFYKSNLLFYLYYYQDEIKHEEDRDEIYNLMCDEALRFYTKTYNNAIHYRNSLDYKIGHILLSPLRYLKHIIE